MVEKCKKNKFETDFEFHEFFFKSISKNDQQINEKDLDAALLQLGMQGGDSTEKIIQRTENDNSATTITFGKFHDRLANLTNFKGKKKGGLGDGFSDAQTVYEKPDLKKKKVSEMRK